MDAYREIFPLGMPAGYTDPSLEDPDAQRAYLAEMLQAGDDTHPAPYSATPPWGESQDESEWISDQELAENYVIAADVEAAAGADLLSVVSDYFPPDLPELHWQNDDQYHGLGVNPGVENLEQPVEFGWQQAIPPRTAAEHGWDAWSGRPVKARVARMFNDFPGYGKGVKRGLGTRPVEKLEMPLALQTQMYRDMLLIELKRRGVHNVVVQDVPSVPYTQEVLAVDPSVLTPEPEIGPEGVLA